MAKKLLSLLLAVLTALLLCVPAIASQEPEEPAQTVEATAAPIATDAPKNVSGASGSDTVVLPPRNGLVNKDGKTDYYDAGVMQTGLRTVGGNKWYCADKNGVVTQIIPTAEQLLSQMTLDEKIYQLFMVTPEQLTGASQVTQTGTADKTAIQNQPVGGIVYFAQNLVSRNQCIQMIWGIQSACKIPLFIAVDEEGGTVARVGSNSAMGTTVFPSMAKIGAAGDTFQAYSVGYTIGTDIAALGFNLDFAPVADVYTNPKNTVIGARAFSGDAHIAADMVGACVRGFQASGILCTLKHFPGHGDTVADSHYGEAETSKTLDELWEEEFLPFIAGIEAGAPAVMVGHITAPNAVDEAVPATLSYTFVTEILREQMGFNGLVITDAMRMQAITQQYSSGEAAVRAIQAGVDIILAPDDLAEAVSGIRSAVKQGAIAEDRIDESVLRILNAKIACGLIK